MLESAGSVGERLAARVTPPDATTLAAAADARRARARRRLAMRYYRGGFDVTIKPDQTPVTQADQEAERTIIEILGSRVPRLRVSR